jgi:hypothetical protein
MFDEYSPLVLIAFFGTLAVGAVVSKLIARPRRRDDHIHPAE